MFHTDGGAVNRARFGLGEEVVTGRGTLLRVEAEVVFGAAYSEPSRRAVCILLRTDTLM